jgi:hypothetical protein
MSIQARFGMPLEDTGRSKTILNGNAAVLVAAPGYEIAVAQDQDGTPAAPQRVLAIPVDQVFEDVLWDFRTDKRRTYRVTTSREWLERLKANTLTVWGDRAIPVFRHHDSYSPASGWFRAGEIEVDEQGLWIRAEWIGDTAGLIAQRQYRYVSASWYIDKVDPATGKTISEYVVEVSLTNSPYFKQQPGLAADAGPIILAALSAAATPNQEEVDMDPKKLAELLGLKAEATEEEVLSAIKAAAAGATELNTIKTALALAQGETAEGKIKALMEATPPAAEETAGKPKAEAQALGAAAAELLVDAAVAAGKIPPQAKEPWIKAVAAVPLADAKALLAAIPKAVPDAEALKDKAKGGETSAVDASLKAALESCGLTAEDFAKFGQEPKQKEAAAG